MSELRWLDGGQPSVPDPTQDRHVAFPDDFPNDTGGRPRDSGSSKAPGVGSGDSADDPYRDLAIEVVGTGRDGQPVSARISLAPSVQWGWRAGELPGTPRGSRPRKRRHTNRVVPGLIALVLVALVVRPGGSVESSSSTSGQVVQEGVVPVKPPEGVVPAPLRVTVLSASEAEGLVMTEPRYDLGTMPKGPSSVRVEVVSNDGSSAYVAVTNEGGGFEKVVSLPFAARVTVPDGTVPFRVTALSNGDSATVQCRVYAGSHLVATSTAVGTVDCEPTPAAR